MLIYKDNGRANSENKYDLPPPVDEQFSFEEVLLVCYDNKTKHFNILQEEWEAKYEGIGGFENLDEDGIAKKKKY